MNDFNENTHTDTMDVDFDISLNEYGIARNPDNGDTVFCLNPDDNYEMNENPNYQYRHLNISLQDVKDALNDASDGFFDFIGSDLNTELDNLDNDFLSHMILSLNQYNGHFSPFNY